MRTAFIPSKTSVCVIGLGYIGLPTASVLATKGFRVFGIDVRPEIVETINAGRIHIEEPDLDILVRSAVNSGQLTARLEACEADVFILCVPTPFRDDHSPDLSYVEQACQSIRPWVRPGNLIILESTSPPRTTENIVQHQAVPAGLTVGRDIFVAHCPERVLPGRILLEVVQNDRVVEDSHPLARSEPRSFTSRSLTVRSCRPRPWRPRSPSWSKTRIEM